MSEMNNKRLYGMDALRAIAMLLGVVLHAAIVYQVNPRPGWPQDSLSSFWGYDILYAWIHSFRMPLFFLVAGFFARFLYFKVGEKDFIGRRIKRIVLPFIVGLLVISPLSALPFIYYQRIVSGIPTLDALNGLWKEFFHWNGMYHLWFLYYLLVYYLLMVAFIKAFDSIKNRYPGYDFNVTLPSHSPRYILFLSAILFIIIQVFFNVHVEPWTGVKLKWGQILYYGLFFGIGYVTQKDMHSLKSSVRYVWPYMILGTFLIFPIMWLQHQIADNTENQLFFLKTITRALMAFQTMILVFGSLGLFMKYFEKKNNLILYLSDSSYWFYLIHFPIVVSMQIMLFYSEVPGYLRFWIVLGVTTAISMLTYQFWVRYTFLGTILHGYRRKENKSIYKVSSLKALTSKSRE